ncbi:MAG TPA: hypothetical protein VMT42_04845, partial [candidate division Zixibacteria bacterium]|nr:hypothetical protein [candidate division Zixibacteria bacterium]
ILEFIVAALLFLMAGFTLTSYTWFIQTAASNYGHDTISHAVLILGVGAILGFILGLAGSVSAVQRKNWTLSVVAALATSFWGILLCFYTLLTITDPASAYVGWTVGYIVIILSAISGLLVITSKRAFQPTHTY